MSIWRSQAALLGKTRWRLEFLRTSGLSPELHSFDEWLFKNASALPDDGVADSGFSERAAYGFLMQTDAPGQTFTGIAGVIGPSCDQAGRSFPLALATPVTMGPQVARHPEIAPIVLESYWQAASEMLFTLRAVPPEAGDRSLERLTEAPTESATGAFDAYVDWARHMRVGEMAALLERPVSWLDRAVRWIADAVATPARNGRAASAHAIRVPLGRAGGGALCFWLHVIRRASFSPARAPSFFWSHDGRGGDALLFLRAPDEKTLATLWRVGGDDQVWDLTSREWHPQHGPSAEAPEDAQRTLWTLLQQPAVASRGVS
ncbi:MAG: type VI secretion system-associated protein TagF [Myxococcota bacterium]|nr:type VI secretion system-associated protein TagF [Myxococcota bacterium]